MALLEVDDLRTYFRTDDGIVKAVDGVTFSIEKGQTLGIVAETADDVVVMYAARIQEQASVDNLFRLPQHPYTWGLLGSLPRLDQNVERLVQIPGQPPSLLESRVPK